jgi:hypothetical protein
MLTFTMRTLSTNTRVGDALVTEKGTGGRPYGITFSVTQTWKYLDNRSCMNRMWSSFVD